MRLTILSFLLLTLWSCSSPKEVSIEKEYVSYLGPIPNEHNEPTEYLRHLLLLSSGTYVYRIYVISNSESEIIQLSGQYEQSEDALDLTIEQSHNFDCATKQIHYDVGKIGHLHTPNDKNLMVRMQRNLEERVALQYNNCVDNVGENYLTVFMEKENFLRFLPAFKERIEEIIKK